MENVVGKRVWIGAGAILLYNVTSVPGSNEKELIQRQVIVTSGTQDVVYYFL
jgi:hypothetical protein